MVAQSLEVVDEGVAGVEITSPESLSDAVLGKAARGECAVDAHCAEFIDKTREFGHDGVSVDARVEHVVSHGLHDDDDDVAPVEVRH